MIEERSTYQGNARGERAPAPSDAEGTLLDTMQLEQFGYPQELKRVLGFFASFALQFSLICVSGAVFLLYNYGLTTAGPALFFWAWVIGGTLQMTVGLS